MAVLGGVVVSRFANALVSSIVFVGIQNTVSLAFLFFAVAPVLQVMEDGYVKSMAGAAEALNDVFRPPGPRDDDPERCLRGK